MRELRSVALLGLLMSSGLLAEAQGDATPRFEAVSIKRSTPGALGGSFNQRPDGGFTMTNVPTRLLISRAYPPAVPEDMVGLPGWAMSDRYDVSATSSLPTATAAQRIAMLRTMLEDRFKLVVHVENRDQPVYELVPARSDGKLGPGLTRIDADCDAVLAERVAARSAAPAPPQFPDLNAPPPPCVLRSVGRRGQVGELLEGETSMANLAGFLRAAVGTVVVDRTRLAGSYRVRMSYDLLASRRGPDVVPAPEAAPTAFTALPEQLGLKLQRARAALPTLVVDRLERPSEN